MKKCTLTFGIWLHSLDDECAALENNMQERFCEDCKWFKEEKK